MLSVNLMCAGVGVAIGALMGAAVPLGLAGCLIGFLWGVYVVARRFHDL